MNVYAISFKEKGNKQVEQVKPHVILIHAEDENEAWLIGRREIKRYGGDLRTLKWAGDFIPLLKFNGDMIICPFGNIEEVEE